MGHDVYSDGSCRVYVRKLSCEVLNCYIRTKIVSGEAPAVIVIVNEIPKHTLCELVMEGYNRSYVQCRSGRLAGSLIHTVMPGRRNSSANKPQTQKATNLVDAVVNLDAADKNIKEFFKKKRCTVVIKNSPAVQEVFDDIPKLRKRKLQNYVELSMSLTDVGNKIDKHIPIYNQLSPHAKTERTDSDLYEFDSDSENMKKKRRRKAHNPADDSMGFEKGMKDIMRVIEKNFKRNQAGQRKKIKKNGPVSTARHVVKPKAIEKQVLYKNVELLNTSTARNSINPGQPLNKEVELLNTSTARNNINPGQPLNKEVELLNTSTAGNNINPGVLLNEEVELLSTTQHDVNPPETQSYVTEANAGDLNCVPTANGADVSSDFQCLEEIIETEIGSQSRGFCIETTDKTINNLEIIDSIFDEETHQHNESESDLFGFSDESHAFPPETQDKSANSVKPTIETDDLFGFNSEFIEPPPQTNNMRPTVETLDFGFNSESSPKTKDQSANRINIISNVVINPNSYKDFHRPNANSTMVLTRTPKKRSSSPWRPDLGLTRNPYLLQFKDTLLPNYNQEMVLDSTISDKNCSDVSKTPMKPTETPKTHQTSILRYLNGSKGNHEVGVTRESSLFDDDDFSPIKPAEGHVDVNKENLSPRKTSTALKKIKRDILGENTAANRMPLSPLQNLTNYSRQASQEDIADYFGFNSVTEEDKENVSMKPKKPLKIYFNKPVRFGDVLKQTVKNNVHVEGESVVNPVEDSIVKEPVPVEDNVVKNKEKEPLMKDNTEQDEDVPLRLFEDLDDKAPIRKYPPKRTRRPREHSFMSENSDDENHHHKQKKKNARTKEEEEEFERWAVAFNSMCKEVDEYALEIE